MKLCPRELRSLSEIVNVHFANAFIYQKFIRECNFGAEQFACDFCSGLD